MSKVKLIVFEGYGTNYQPYINDNHEVIDLDIRVPESHSIGGIIRTDFDPDKDGSTRVSDDFEQMLTTNKVNNLTGKVLTQIDAMISDPEQRKAMKDIFRDILWNWYADGLDGLREPWQLDKFPKFKNRFDEK